MKNLVLILGILFSSLCFAAETIVFVVDGSGSMDERISYVTPQGEKILTNRMEAAKNTLKEVAEHLPKDTKVGVVCFPAYNWIYPIAEINRSRFVPAIDQLTPTGGTPLGEYMKIGADALLEARKSDPYSKFKLVIITDGAANDPNFVDLYVKDIKNRGIVVNTIGVGMDNSHQLATQTSYQSADNATALKEAVESAVAEVSEDGPSSNSILSELALLPEDSAQPMLKSVSGLVSVTANHPIGTIPVVESKSAGNTTNVQTSNLQAPSSIPISLVVIIVLVIVLAIVVLFDFMRRS